MDDQKDPIITRNFLMNLSRGLVKSLPGGGALLEQVIYGTLDGETAGREADKLHAALSGISQEIDGQHATLSEILKVLPVMEDHAGFREEVLVELRKLNEFINDPDHADTPEKMESVSSNGVVFATGSIGMVSSFAGDDKVMVS